MAQQFSEITPYLQTFIGQQQLFFVGTAARDGRVNVSPKGLDSLRVLGPKRVVWLNLTGSGNETAAHLLDTNRMTLMFCAFAGKPMILRLYGSARTYHAGQPAWQELIGLFPPMPGARQLFDMQVELVQTSCGFAVPYFQYQGQRDTLINWAETKGPQGITAYWAEKNAQSLDGKPTDMGA